MGRLEDNADHVSKLEGKPIDPKWLNAFLCNFAIRKCRSGYVRNVLFMIFLFVLHPPL
jgi:hypothetical protein